VTSERKLLVAAGPAGEIDVFDLTNNLPKSKAPQKKRAVLKPVAVFDLSRPFFSFSSLQPFLDFAFQQLRQTLSTAIIRQAIVSDDYKYVVAVSDENLVFVWKADASK